MVDRVVRSSIGPMPCPGQSTFELNSHDHRHLQSTHVINMPSARFVSVGLWKGGLMHQNGEDTIPRCTDGGTEAATVHHRPQPFGLRELRQVGHPPVPSLCCRAKVGEVGAEHGGDIGHCAGGSVGRPLRLG